MQQQKKVLLTLAAIAVLFVVGIWFAWAYQSGPGARSKTVAYGQQLVLARKLLEQGQPEKCLEALKPLTPDARHVDAPVQLLQMRAYRDARMHKELASAAEAFLKQFPESNNKVEVEGMRLAAEVAQGGIGKGNTRDAVERFLEANPGQQEAGSLLLAVSRQEASAGNITGAAARLTKALELPGLAPATETEIATELGNLNWRLLMDGPRDTDETYSLKKGESIATVARKYGVTQEFLQAVNKIDKPRNLKIGQKLRVPKVNFTMVCDVAANTLTLKDNGVFFKRYTVRTGREKGATPEGTYKVLNKKVNPIWRPGDGRVFAGGDPNNELGTRWMSFQGDILGIHGTIHPETVGEYASNGCIGMRTEDVEQLFDLLTTGTPLQIVGQQDLSRHKVIPAPAPATPGEKARSVAMR